MKAIILAAGQGMRLKKYTENLPKGMLVFQGRTIIERQIELYRECGIDDIIVIKGFAANKITYKNIKYYINKEFAETNMVESLMTARTEFDDAVIISYSDILFTKEMLQIMIKNKEDFAVAVDVEWEKYWKMRYGRVDFDTESLKIDEEGNITSLGLENPSMDEIDARYIGLLKFSQKGLRKITNIWDENYEEYLEKPWQQSGKTIRKAYMTDLLNALIESSNQVKAIMFRNGWIEFDTNEDYENACEWVNNGRIKELL